MITSSDVAYVVATYAFILFRMGRTTGAEFAQEIKKYYAQTKKVLWAAAVAEKHISWIDYNGIRYRYQLTNGKEVRK